MSKSRMDDGSHQSSGLLSPDEMACPWKSLSETCNVGWKFLEIEAHIWGFSFVKQRDLREMEARIF